MTDPTGATPPGSTPAYLSGPATPFTSSTMDSTTPTSTSIPMVVISTPNKPARPENANSPTNNAPATDPPAQGRFGGLIGRGCGLCHSIILGGNEHPYTFVEHCDHVFCVGCLSKQQEAIKSEQCPTCEAPLGRTLIWPNFIESQLKRSQIVDLIEMHSSKRVFQAKTAYSPYPDTPIFGDVSNGSMVYLQLVFGAVMLVLVAIKDGYIEFSV